MPDDSGVFVEDRLTGNIPAAAAILVGALEETALHYAVEIQNHAQNNAPWEDRTGDARDGLDVTVENNGKFIDIILAHSVDYGQWLETIQHGKFAIIMPTLEYFAPEILKNIHYDIGDLE